MSDLIYPNDSISYCDYNFYRWTRVNSSNLFILQWYNLHIFCSGRGVAQWVRHYLLMLNGPEFEYGF